MHRCFAFDEPTNSKSAATDNVADNVVRLQLQKIKSMLIRMTFFLNVKEILSYSPSTYHCWIGPPLTMHWCFGLQPRRTKSISAMDYFAEKGVGLQLQKLKSIVATNGFAENGVGLHLQKIKSLLNKITFFLNAEKIACDSPSTYHFRIEPTSVKPAGRFLELARMVPMRSIAH